MHRSPFLASAARYCIRVALSTRSYFFSLIVLKHTVKTVTASVHRQTACVSVSAFPTVLFPQETLDMNAFISALPMPAAAAAEELKFELSLYAAQRAPGPHQILGDAHMQVPLVPHDTSSFAAIPFNSVCHDVQGDLWVRRSLVATLPCLLLGSQQQRPPFQMNLLADVAKKVRT
jgi:hypothetical protein